MNNLKKDLGASTDHSHLVTDKIVNEWVEMMREEMSNKVDFKPTLLSPSNRIRKTGE